MNSKYSKAIVAVAGATVAALTYLYSDATWLPVLVNLLTALGVYQIPNKRPLVAYELPNRLTDSAHRVLRRERLTSQLKCPGPA